MKNKRNGWWIDPSTSETHVRYPGLAEGRNDM